LTAASHSKMGIDITLVMVCGWVLHLKQWKTSNIKYSVTAFVTVLVNIFEIVFRTWENAVLVKTTSHVCLIY